MQKLITDSNRFDFTAAVNEHLSHGWKVVPGTLVASVSNAGISGFGNYAGTCETVTLFGIVVEKVLTTPAS